MKDSSKLAVAGAAFVGVLAWLKQKAQKVAGIGALSVDHPKVYVGTYGKYNNGSLFGEWVDLTKFDTYADFMDYIRELHKDEDDPEFMIQDYSGFPEAFYTESGMDEETFDRIKDYWEYVASDEDNREAYDVYTRYFGRDDDVDGYSPENFRERYVGWFARPADFVEHLLDEGLIDMQYLFDEYGMDTYLDYDAIWRTMQQDYTEAEGYYFYRR